MYDDDKRQNFTKEPPLFYKPLRLVVVLLAEYVYDSKRLKWRFPSGQCVEVKPPPCASTI